MAGPHAPIVLLTGAEIDANIVQEIGAAGMIPKPFSVSQFLEVVSRFADCVERP